MATKGQPLADISAPSPLLQADSRSLFAAIVESSEDAIISKDLQGIIRSWNRGAEQIFGYTAAEVLGKPVSMLAVPERADEMPDILQRIRRGERVEHYETERRTKDGRVLNVSLTVSPIRDSDGRIVGASKIARDISERVREDKARRDLERQLLLLIEASSALLSSPELGDVLRHVLDAATQFVKADAYAVWRKQTGTPVWKLITSEGLSEHYEAKASEEAGSGQQVPQAPVVIEDVENFPLVRHRLPFYRSEGIRSMLTIPLRIHGEVGGTLVFYERKLRRFGEQEVRLATALGSLAAAAVGIAEMYELQVSLRAEAERARREASFLAEAGAVLSSSLDYSATLARVAQAAVPDFADWCAVDILDREGNLNRVGLAHQDPVMVELARALRQKYPPTEADLSVVALRTGQSVLVEEVTDAMIVAGARDAEHLRDLRALNIGSCIIAPMLARGESVGTLTFVIAGTERRYRTSDLSFAEELARRAATAIDNAELFEQVREREGRFRQLADAIPAFVWVADPEGQCTYLNSRWYEYTGLKPDWPLASGWAAALPAEDLERAMPAWDEARRRQTPFAMEMRVRNAAGDYRWFMARALPVRDYSGRIVRWIGTSTDIHDSKRTEEALRTAVADLEQFAYSASHDLKEPLRMVAIYSQLLQRNYSGKLDPQADQYLTYAVQGAQRMDMLVDDLLAYTRVTAGREDNVAPADPRRAVKEALANLRTAISESSATVEIGNLPDSLRVKEAHLLQLFQNLIGNAIKYRGDQPPVVNIAAEYDGVMWKVWVKDNGIGIDPDYAEQVFGIFRRLHTADRYPGTGIGLAICQKIVHRYGGRIWVEAGEEGRGSAFFFTIPGPPEAG